MNIKVVQIQLHLSIFSCLFYFYFYLDFTKLYIFFLFAGNSEYHNANLGFNDDFSLDFVNDDTSDQKYLDDGNMNELTSSPSFEVVEEIKVNHGMFVSSRQVAKTFFHQIVPSETVKVHLNLATISPANLSYSIHKVEKKLRFDSKDDFSKNFKSFRRWKFIRIIESIKSWGKISSVVAFTIVLLLMHCFYIGEDIVEKNTYLMDDHDNLREKDGFKKNINMNKWYQGIQCNVNGSSTEDLVASCNVYMKKLGLVLAVALALCGMWVNNNII